MATRIQIRRDTATNWATENPVLSSGELGAETDTSKLKVGDGSTAWNSLQYVSDAAGGNFSLNDNDKILLGTGDDLEIYHDSLNSYIVEVGTGNLYIRGSSQVIIGGTNGEASIIATENGATSLLHDNSTKLATTSTGITITGDINASGNITASGAGTTTVNSITLGDWVISLDGTSLLFTYDGTDVLSLTEDGLLTAADDVAAFGTP
jgi:hypothetical protein